MTDIATVLGELERDFPAGAIENGRLLAERHNWPEVMQCFEWMANWCERAMPALRSTLGSVEMETTAFKPCITINEDAGTTEVTFYAARPSPSGDGWNYDMENAPRDGTIIDLLAHHRKDTTLRRLPDCNYTKKNWGWELCSNYNRPISTDGYIAVAWCLPPPLPAPPAKE